MRSKCRSPRVSKGLTSTFQVTRGVRRTVRHSDWLECYALANARASALVATLLSLFICFGCLAVPGQNVEKKPTPTPERPREIVALLNDARLAAPELAVDTFLKVVESKKVTDPVWRKEIIDEALRMIDDVQYPMPMRPAYGGKVERNNELLDTEDWVLAAGSFAKLDRLSFRGRVITLLLETDRERAKQMIFQMGGQLSELFRNVLYCNSLEMSSFR